MDSMVATDAVEDNNLFVIDTVGEKPEDQINDVPVKKLKRRNLMTRRKKIRKR